MILKVSYNDESENLVNELEKVIPSKYALVKLETYHEKLFSEKKKAFKLKGGYSAKKTPFAVLTNDDGQCVMAFYSEADQCNYEMIIETLNNYVVYGSKSEEA